MYLSPRVDGDTSAGGIDGRTAIVFIFKVLSCDQLDLGDDVSERAQRLLDKTNDAEDEDGDAAGGRCAEKLALSASRGAIHHIQLEFVGEGRAPGRKTHYPNAMWTRERFKEYAPSLKQQPAATHHATPHL